MINKIITVALISSQIGFSGAAFASDINPAIEMTDNTYEVQLLDEATLLDGDLLPKSELKQKLNTVFAEYDQTAPIDGREERLSQALVDFGLMSKDQSTTFRTLLIQRLQDGLSANPKMNPLEYQVFAKKIIATMPGFNGSQFSCNHRMWLGGVMVATAITAIVFITQMAKHCITDSQFYGAGDPGLSCTASGGVVKGSLSNGAVVGSVVGAGITAAVGLFLLLGDGGSCS